ncbi:MAG: hypothetical protein AB1345_10850 [Chloroflexota bacterium]
MELILATISAGGLIGVADQYMCLIIISVAAKLGWIELSPQTGFMESWWFLSIVAVFWLLTVAPAYLTTVAPGVMNSINTAVNFLSGFVVPLSGAMIALASVGIITNLNPETRHILETLRIFGTGGRAIGSGAIIAGGGALAAMTLTAIKGAAKPGLSASTGTLGHVSAPVYTTIENVASFIVMGLLYALASINPWLIVLLLVIFAFAFAGLLVYSIAQLRKLKSTVGQFFRLLRSQPLGGLTVAFEFLIWGLGWMIRGRWLRGFLMVTFWILYGLMFWLFWGLTSILPVFLFIFIPFSIITFFIIGSSSARALMKTYKIPD